MSRLSTYAGTSSTRSTGGSRARNWSTQTSTGIAVDWLGWPIVEVQRAHWPHRPCQRCTNATALEYIPTDTLGKAWQQYMDSPEQALLALCKTCFKIARSEEGRRYGYKVVKGKTRKYVEEELFGGDIDGPAY